MCVRVHIHVSLSLSSHLRALRPHAAPPGDGSGLAKLPAAGGPVTTPKTPGWGAAEGVRARPTAPPPAPAAPPTCRASKRGASSPGPAGAACQKLKESAPTCAATAQPGPGVPDHGSSPGQPPPSLQGSPLRRHHHPHHHPRHNNHLRKAQPLLRLSRTRVRHRSGHQTPLQGTPPQPATPHLPCPTRGRDSAVAIAAAPASALGPRPPPCAHRPLGSRLRPPRLTALLAPVTLPRRRRSRSPSSTIWRAAASAMELGK